MEAWPSAKASRDNINDYTEDMVDDLFKSEAISKEYLEILHQIEDFCSHSVDPNLDYHQKPTGKMAFYWCTCVRVFLVKIWNW